MGCTSQRLVLRVDYFSGSYKPFANSTNASKMQEDFGYQSALTPKRRGAHQPGHDRHVLVRDNTNTREPEYKRIS